MSVLQLNLQLSNMESEIMFYFSLLCNMHTAGQNGQEISNNHVSLCKYNPDPERRTQTSGCSKGSVSIAKREMVFNFKSKNKICEDGNERHQFRLMV